MSWKFLGLHAREMGLEVFTEDQGENDDQFSVTWCNLSRSAGIRHRQHPSLTHPPTPDYYTDIGSNGRNECVYANFFS